MQLSNAIELASNGPAGALTFPASGTVDFDEFMEMVEREEAEKYFEQHEVVVNYFESRTSIDFSSKDFKFTNKMDFISVRDRIQKKKVL